MVLRKHFGPLSSLFNASCFDKLFLHMEVFRHLSSSSSGLGGRPSRRCCDQPSSLQIYSLYPGLSNTLTAFRVHLTDGWGQVWDYFRLVYYWMLIYIHVFRPHHAHLLKQVTEMATALCEPRREEWCSRDTSDTAELARCAYCSPRRKRHTWEWIYASALYDTVHSTKLSIASHSSEEIAYMEEEGQRLKLLVAEITEEEVFYK